jgi:hypothetical protein
MQLHFLELQSGCGRQAIGLYKMNGGIVICKSHASFHCSFSFAMSKEERMMRLVQRGDFDNNKVFRRNSDI